jgi:hypothetical protein
VYQPWRTGCESSGHPAFYDLVCATKEEGTAQPRLLHHLRNNFLRQMKNELREQKVVANPVRVALRNKCHCKFLRNAKARVFYLQARRRPSEHMGCGQD